MFENPITAAHVFDAEAAFFAETYVFDLFLLCYLKVFLRSKATVKGHLERIATINLMLPIQHLRGQGGIGRIALNNDTVGDQPGTTASDTYLVSIQGVTVILDDNIGVRLKDGDDLFT